MKKILIIILASTILIIAAAAAFVKFGMPQIKPPQNLHVDITPERIKRGEYLANHVSECVGCHSTRDWSKYSGPIVQGTLGKGGEYFGPEMGFPGKIYAKNITPAHLKEWSDGEIFRAMTCGVNAKGGALFPLMPYQHFSKMDKEDIYDIIAYVRSIPAIENNVPEHEMNFPMNFIINTIPSEGHLGHKPSRSDTINYGCYLVNAAGCIECHTKDDKGRIIPELAFSGGREFIFPDGKTYSANITPDLQTGIGSWNVEAFVGRFKAYKDSANFSPLRKNQQNTPMPWSLFAGMETSDLRSIYAYLRSLKPMKNRVNHFVLAGK